MFCEKSTRCNFTLITKSEETCPICFPVFTLFVLLFLDTTVEEKIQEIEGVIDLLATDVEHLLKNKSYTNT